MDRLNRLEKELIPIGVELFRFHVQFWIVLLIGRCCYQLAVRGMWFSVVLEMLVSSILFLGFVATLFWAVLVAAAVATCVCRQVLGRNLKPRWVRVLFGGLAGYFLTAPVIRFWGGFLLGQPSSIGSCVFVIVSTIVFAFVAMRSEVDTSAVEEYPMSLTAMMGLVGVMSWLFLVISKLPLEHQTYAFGVLGGGFFCVVLVLTLQNWLPLPNQQTASEAD